NEFTQDIISKTYNNIENTLSYWTQERMLNAKPLLTPLKFNKTINSDEKNMVNTITSEDENDKPFAVGILYFTQNSSDWQCTASFCPGYDNGKESRYGCVGVVKTKVPNDYIANFNSDYGTLKFDFHGQGRLQDHSGCLGWGIIPKYPVEIVTFGDPGDGDMNCAKNSFTFCSWRGNAQADENSDIVTVPLDLGHGSSGGPWLIKNSPPSNIGYLIGITSGGPSDDSTTFSDALDFDLIRQLISW
ncbi:24490_t:CDS:2, partial [Dentiscutata erythropus]